MSLRNYTSGDRATRQIANLLDPVPIARDARRDLQTDPRKGMAQSLAAIRREMQGNSEVSAGAGGLCWDRRPATDCDVLAEPLSVKFGSVRLRSGINNAQTFMPNQIRQPSPTLPRFARAALWEDLSAAGLPRPPMSERQMLVHPSAPIARSATGGCCDGPARECQLNRSAIAPPKYGKSFLGKPSAGVGMEIPFSG